MLKRILCVLLLLGPSMVLAEPASAQAYPNRPIRFIVPYPPGGPTDSLARLVANQMTADTGWTIVVENRAGGAAGTVGTKAVISAPPDGYTVLITAPGPITNAPAVYKNIDYDPLKVLEPVSLLVVSPIMVVINASLPINTLPELIAYAKANPGAVKFASQGFGTSTHLLGELLKMETSLDLVHVPYRGAAPALTDLMAGQTQLYFDTPQVVAPHIRSGKLRALAIADGKRFFAFPDVPSTDEVGLPSLKSMFWLGMLVPAGTPDAIVTTLNAAANKAMEAPAVRSKLADLGVDVRLGSPADFRKLITEELEKWNGVSNKYGIKIE
jgi:tripartite-type tricarboxylate transporter receptor subunit TctC